jgi:hypothetical protein
LILSLDITVLEKLGGLTSVHHLALLDWILKLFLLLFLLKYSLLLDVLILKEHLEVLHFRLRFLLFRVLLRIWDILAKAQNQWRLFIILFLITTLWGLERWNISAPIGRQTHFIWAFREHEGFPILNFKPFLLGQRMLSL